MKIKRFTFSPFQENTYLIWDEVTAETIIIDPSCLSEEEETELKLFVENENLKVKFLFNTHGHLDHIFGNAFVMGMFTPQHIIPEIDLPLFDKGVEQAKSFGLEMKESPKSANFFSESEVLLIGNIEIKFLFTPGHTEGEYCIYFPSENVCITGDVLFKESIGRTDLWGGDIDTLLDSINNKLFILPDETIIYPGHGESSTIKHEKINNPFLNSH